MARPSVTPPSPTGNRRVIAGGPWHDFGPPVGRRKLVIRNPGLMFIEEALDDQLDRMNDRIAKGRGPIGDDGDRIVDEFSTVWEALEQLWRRWPNPTVYALLVAAFESQLEGRPETRLSAAQQLYDDIDSSLIDETLLPKLFDAVNLALGVDTKEQPARPPTAPPTTVDGAPSSSDGTSSSPSGPAPSDSEA